jgi:signal transduction histidine kinase
VPPGRYDFEVRAANNDGVWSDTPARIGITLQPRFHQTRAFYAIVVLSLMLAGALGYAMHVRGLHARRRELERLVQERTRALAEQQRLSEEARAEAERQRENAERQKEIAQQATAVKTELLQIAAHDLKNPLQVVLGHAEMAEVALREGKPPAEFVGHIHQAAERMLAILTRLLDASAMDAGKLVLRPAAHRPRRTWPATWSRPTSPRPCARARPWTSWRRRSCPSFGDADRLVEVIENLVGNAIKYSPLSSRIVVTARRHDGRAVGGGAGRGPGLSDDDKRRMFGRFQRLSATPTGGRARHRPRPLHREAARGADGRGGLRVQRGAGPRRLLQPLDAVRASAVGKPERSPSGSGSRYDVGAVRSLSISPMEALSRAQEEKACRHRPSPRIPRVPMSMRVPWGRTAPLRSPSSWSWTITPRAVRAAPSCC